MKSLRKEKLLLAMVVMGTLAPGVKTYAFDRDNKPFANVISDWFSETHYYRSQDEIPNSIWVSKRGYSGYMYKKDAEVYTLAEGGVKVIFRGILWKGPFAPLVVDEKETE